MWMRLAGIAFLAALGVSPAGKAEAQEAPLNHSGRAVYARACASCHDNPAGSRAAQLASLQAMTPTRIRDALTQGVMKPMAAGLTGEELNDVVAYLTYGQRAPSSGWTDAIKCGANKTAVDTHLPVISAGFGVNANQTRSLTTVQSGIGKDGMKSLKVKWAIALPGDGPGTGAAVLGDTVFVSSGERMLALDAPTGCVKWSYAATSYNTPAIGEIGDRKVLAFSEAGAIHVVDAETGERVWKASGQPKNGTGGEIRGGVIFAGDTIIVPISNSGVVTGMDPKTECCTGHGSVIALKATDGSWLWEYHTMPEPEYTGQVNRLGVRQKGPSGAPIWSVPLHDRARNRIIVTTGENTSHPGTDTSDAVIALDLASGKVVWRFQAMAADVWNMACDVYTGEIGPNCPVLFGGDGRDFDFGAGAVLVKAKSGKDIILAGQKSGHVWALDAKTGKVLWSQRIGEGTALGGVHWGLASDGEYIFAPINDPFFGGDPEFVSRAGVYAFDVETGKRGWSYAALPDCEGERARLVSNCKALYGFSAAPLVIGDAVVAATLGGQVIVFDRQTGEVLNTIDTVGPIATINAEIPGKGGSIDSHGLSAGAGMIFVNSGYSAFSQTPGNVLIALAPGNR